MQSKPKNKLTDSEIKKSLFLMGGKYLLANIYTSFTVVAFLFIIAVIIGFESDEGNRFFNSPVLHTIMMPPIIWYFGYIAFQDGYKHSLKGKYNKKKVILASVPVFVIQLLFVILAIKESEEIQTFAPMQTIASFLLNPYTLFYKLMPELMPMLMLPFTVIEPIVLYIGYSLSLHKEIDDHLIKEDAQAFRERLEKEQYGRTSDKSEGE